MIQLLLSYLLKASILLAMTAALGWLLGRRRAAMRHLIWAAGLGAALALLVLVFLVPQFHLGVLGAGVAGWTLNIIVLVWLATMVLMLGRILLDGFSLNRLVARGSQSVSERLSALAAETAADLGVTRTVRLCRWSGAVPATFGTLRPTILLPTASDSWLPERLRLVLLHEMAHIARFDAALLMIARVATAVLWFNPLSWWGLRRIRTDCEAACDELVVRTGADPVQYAVLLLETASDRNRQAAPTGALAMTSSVLLEERLESILSAHPSAGGRWIGTTFAIAVAASALLMAPVRLEAPNYLTYTKGPHFIPD